MTGHLIGAFLTAAGRVDEARPFLREAVAILAAIADPADPLRMQAVADLEEAERNR